MKTYLPEKVLAAIYADWSLEQSDRQRLDAMGLEGAEHLCAVHVMLGQVFAHNPQLAKLWPTTPNRALQNLSPMDVIRRDGLAGLKRVRAMLESTW